VVSQQVSNTSLDERGLINVRCCPLCGLKADISRGPRSAKTGREQTQQMRSLFGHALKRDHQYKLSPIDIPAMADGSPQLF
jgi:hypothetical protein